MKNLKSFKLICISFFLFFTLNTGDFNYVQAQTLLAAVEYNQAPPAEKVKQKTKFQKKKHLSKKQKRNYLNSKNTKNRKIKVGRTLLIIGLILLGLGLIVAVLGLIIGGTWSGAIIAILGGLIAIPGLALTIAGAITLRVGKREAKRGND